MASPRYRAPTSVPEPGSPMFRPWLLSQLREIAQDHAALGVTDPPTSITLERVEVPAGAQRRVQPTASGMVAVLEAPSSKNAGASVTFFIENPSGTLTVVASPHVAADGKVTTTLINGERRATYTLPGVVQLFSNGQDSWTTVAEPPGETGPSTTLQSILDSLDGLSALTPITPERVIGRDSGGAGEAQQLTVDQVLDWLAGDEWGFDGSNDAVSFGNVYQPERTNSFSFSCWIKTGAPGITGVTDFVIFSNADSTGNARGVSLYIHNQGSPHLKLTNVVNTNDLDVRGEAVINDGQLHHLVATYSGGSAPANVQLYIDGVALSKTTILNSLTGTIVAAGNSLRIGRYGANASLFFPGVIRHVSVWDVALSAGNVTALYNSGTPSDLAAVAFVANLDAWWKLDASDDAAAGGVADYGPSNLDGTAEGGLTNGVRPGAIAVRGASDWLVLQPGAQGAALVSTGGNTPPAYGTLDLAAIDSQAGNVVIVNAGSGRAALQAVAMATNTVLLRAGANIVAQALAANELLVRAGADIVALAVGANTVVGRAAGNIVAAQVATGQIANNAVTNAIIRDGGALSVIGRSANSSGDPADISATAASGAVLRESGSALGFGTVATAGVADDAISNAKLRNSGALSVIGRSANSTGDPADISASAASDAVLRESGSALGFGTLAAGALGDAIISPAKLAVLASNRGAVYAIFITAAAGTPGSADDVTIYNADADFAFRILRVQPVITTAIALSTVQLRSASGGGGSALSSTFDSSVAGEPAISVSWTATSTVAASGSLFLRRSDQGVALDLVILAVRL